MFNLLYKLNGTVRMIANVSIFTHDSLTADPTVILIYGVGRYEIYNGCSNLGLIGVLKMQGIQFVVDNNLVT